ncbi:phosphate ABC transporter membrane protein 1, PhoT family [Desulfobulbus propionicus DSM 2032]|jgi:phosphate transport system permease protein|uniref:Phosphate transport system permease protein n=1 Tax=Desulfobulbus propionicus (strain ATCC 33891 / DSM 2032 / VKM B-1956 / 1pr3) TaxID=577650 RepID=A0A7U3YJZ4_DESPD|nr:phosphate ABC transporter permease subunit PstC [Desulfobulbus propionicus]ADW16789.1 phosphate ABC transporter membrane protein 1, PhoT family [Desulfobulbus propionicus DSM 2032]
MSPLLLITIVFLLSSLAFWLGKRRALVLAGRGSGVRMHSRPGYYGLLTGLWCGLPALLVIVAWQLLAEPLLTRLAMDSVVAAKGSLSPEQLGLLTNDLRNLVAGRPLGLAVDPLLQAAADRYLGMERISDLALAATALAAGLIGASVLHGRIRPGLRARNQVELAIEIALILCSILAVFITIGIVLSVLFESIRFFQQVPFTDFLFGLKWSPQMAIRADQAGSSGSFGAVPVLAGTFLISAIAMAIAVPLGLMSAIYLSEYAGPKFRATVKPLLEILAGVPTVVYGFFAALVVAPLIRDLGGVFGLSVASESALAAGLVMGIMIIPFVSSLSDDVINAVPQSLRDGSYGLGATKSETIKLVVLPAALPGIVGSILLAVSRAIGETMIVVMAAGLAANLTLNPLQAVTTVTVQIVTLLVGDQEFDSPKTLAAFALGMLLFVVTLALNVIALYVVRTYREEYE